MPDDGAERPGSDAVSSATARCQPTDTCSGVLKCRLAVLAALAAIRGGE
jgi:hypothetical protein